MQQTNNPTKKINDNVKELYNALVADGAKVGSEDEFNEWFQADKNNRREIYEAFKNDGAKVGEFEEFEAWANPPSLAQRAQAAAESGTFPFVGSVGRQQGVSAENEKKPLWQMSAELGMQGRANREGVQRMESIKKGSALGNAFGGGKEPLTGKRYTESGEETNELGQWYDAQKNNQQRKAEADFGGNIEEQFQEAERKLQESAERDRQRANENESALDYLVAGMQDPNVMTGPKLPEDSEETKERRAIYNALKEADKIVKAAQYSEKHNGWQEFWKSFGKKIGDWETWDMGVSSMLNNGTSLRVIKKLEAANGDETKLTDSERELLDALATQAVVEQYYHDRIGKGYNIGSGVAESVPFMAEMIINPMSGAGSATGKALGKYILKRFGVKGTMKGVMSSVKNKALKQAGKELAGTVVRDVASEAAHLAGSAGMASTTGLANVIAGSYDRQIGKVTGNIGLDGNVDYTGRQQYEANARKAFWKEWGSRTIENFSESGMGAANEAVGDVTTRLIGKMFKGSTAKMVSKAYNGWRKFKKGNFGQVMKRAQWQGMVPEWLEEVEGGIANAIVVGDQTLDRDPETGVFNPGNMWDTFLQVAATSMMIGGGHVASYGIGKGAEAWSNANRLRQTDKEGQTVFGVDGWDDVKQAVEGAVRGISEGKDGIGLSEEGKAAMRGLMEGRSQDEKQAIVDYFGARVKSEVSSAMIADETMTDDERELQNDYSRGYEAMMQSYDEDSEEADQKSMLAASDMAIERDQKRTALAERIGEETVEELEQSRLGGSDIDDQLARMMDEGKIGEGDMEAVKDYMKAHAAYRGVEDFVNEAGDAVSMQARMEMAPTRDEQGNVRKATMKSGKTLYIKGGEVKVQKDGTIDTEGSTEALTAYDPEEEKNVFVNVDDIESMEEKGSDEVEREIEQRGNDFKEAMLNEINGVNTLSVGKEVTAENGMRGIVVAEDADNYILQMEDGQQLPVNKQQYEQELQARRMADYEERHRPTPAEVEEEVREETPEGTETTEEVPSMEATEGAPLEYTPGMQLTLRDEDGNERQAAVLTDVRFELTNNGQFVESPEGRYIALSVEGEDGVVYKRDDILNKEVVRHEGEQPAEAERTEVPEESLTPTLSSEGEGDDVTSEAEPEDAAQVVYDDIKERYGEKAEHKIEVTVKDRQANMEAKRKALVKAQQEYDDAPIGKEEKAEKAVTKAQQEYEEAQTEYENWRAVKSRKDQEVLAIKEEEDRRRREAEAIRRAEAEARAAEARKREEAWREQQRAEAEAERKRMTEQEEFERITANRIDVEDRAEERSQKLAEAKSLRQKEKIAKEIYGEMLGEMGETTDQFDNDVYEYVAAHMPKNLRWDGPDGLQKEIGSDKKRGIGKQYESNMFNKYLAPNGQGTKFGDAVHNLWRSEVNQKVGGNLDARYTEDEIRDALLDLLLNEEDIEGYVLNHRIEVAEAEKQAEENRIATLIEDEWIMEHDGLTKEEYYVWVKELEAMAAEVNGMSEEEYYKPLIENEYDEQRETNHGTVPAERAGEVGETGSSDRESAREGEREEGEPAGVEADGERGADEQQTEVAEQIEAARQQVETQPTEGQKEAGNYAKGHLRLDGYDISLEQPKGSVRSGKDADGREWSQEMHNDYGYIRGTEGVDGDHIDVFLSDNPTEGYVFVVDQVNPKTGEFDEHKVMYGFPDMESARKAYLSNYEEGWKGLGAITEVSKEEFKKWVESSKRKTKPFAEYKSVKARGDVMVGDQQTGVAEAPETTESPEEQYKRYYEEAEAEIAEIESQLDDHPSAKNDKLIDHITEDMFGVVEDVLMSGGTVDDVRLKARYDAAEKWMDENIAGTGPAFQKAGTKLSRPTKEQKELTKGVVEVLKETGVPTHYVTKKGQEMLDKYKEQAKKQKGEPVIFYSNAERAVEGIKQEKATAEQWLKMIEKNGGLKAGEDKWTGLSEWLKSNDKKSLTKQEVLDYIRENQIQVEDVEYEEGIDIDNNPQMQKFREEFNDIKQQNEGGRSDLEVELDKFEDEMYDKYGSGWYNELNDEEIERMEQFNDLSSTEGTSDEKAFREMVDRYGDDFGMAFEVDGNGVLVPINDPYNDSGITEQAEYFLEFDKKPINETRLGYTTDGLDNKREIALVVPTIESWNEGDQIHFGDAGEGRAVAWVRFGETTDADGKKVLVIDEIQSKRHQEGREKGYKGETDKEKIQRARQEQDDYSQLLYDKYIEGKHEGEDFLDYATAEEKAHFEELGRQRYEAEKPMYQGVPDAPFEKNWHEVAMKRMLRYAAENGYDKVAWTKGEQQAERYDLSKAVEKIDIQTVKRDGKDVKMVNLKFPERGQSAMYVSEDGIISQANGLMENANGKHVSEVFGKSLAEKIMNTEWETIEGDGLRIGGEGMKGFYDQILPRFMDKYGKKWSVKTGEVELPNIGDNGLTMWSVDVTPEMKESVMEGQPMFFKTEDGEVLGYTLNGEIYIDPRVATPDTPIHEYTHLWAQGLRSSNPTAWAQLTEEMKSVEDGRLWEYVRGRYPELENEDELTEEVFAHYSGKRGRERLEADMREEMSKTHDVFEKAKVATMFHKLREILSNFWNMARDLFAGKVEGIENLTAYDFADMVLGDLARGFDPRASIEAKTEEIKKNGLKEDEAKTLMGVHNISEEKLRKAIKQGGLANPSMAVIDTKKGGFDSYGNISLIPKSSLIDARTGRNAGTYSGDAYTPTYPSVTKEMTDKGWKHIQAIAEEAAKGNKDLKYHIEHMLKDYVEGNSNRLHLLYLIQKGLNPELKPKRTTHSHEEYEALMKILPGGEYSSDGLTQEQNDALLKLMMGNIEKEAEERASKISDPELREKTRQFVIDRRRENLADEAGNLYFNKWNTYLYDVMRDERERQNPQIDWYDTESEANYRVASEGMAEDYDRWKEQLFDDEDIEEKLFAGYTPDGTRKYLPNTVKNASKLMNRNSDTNSYDQGGLNATKAGLLKKMMSLSDIRKNRDLLQDEETYGQRQEEMSNELFDIIGQISDLQKISDNQFSNIDYAEARLQDAITKRDPIAYLNKEYGYDIDKDSELASQIMNFVEEAQNLPAKYFETKFKRPVALDEFAVAVVPEGTSQEVVDALKKAGLDVRTYDGTSENRQAVTLDAVRGRDDIMFQKGGRTVNDDIRFRSLDPESDEVVDNAEVGTKPLSDKEKVAKLEAEPKVKVYRAMQLIDGKLYPPMSAKVDGKLREPSELGVWEEADENPDMADENGKFTLNKGNGKSLKAAYNPYIHTSATMLNDQFSEAQSRPNLVVVEMEVPESEVEGDYRAEKAKDTVGRKQWKAGVIQGQLSGTREVILSRWAKPVRIVPDAEVAESIAKQIEGQVPVMPSNVVTPQVREEMEKLGVQFVETDNTGKLKEGENAGKTWASVFGKGKSLSEVTRIGEGPQVTYTPYDEALKEAKKAGYTKAKFDRHIERVWNQRKKTAERFAEKLNLGDRVNVILDIDELEGMNLTDRQKRAKGWYDTKTGKIYVIMDNNTSMDDVFQTILHEGVAHHGLRELFGENFDTFLDDVYAHSTEDIRREIASLSKKYNWNVRTATEEYMAKMAETQNFEHPQYESWWRMVKDWFIAMVKKIGMGDWISNHTITENELRFVLWRSWKNLTEPEGNWGYVRQAQDIAMQAELGVGEYADKAPYGRDWKVEKPREDVPAAASGDVKYDELKAQVPDKVIMMKNGELYEIKGEDAKTAAQLLGLPTGEDGVLRIPEDMMEKSLSKLVRSGKKVTIAEPIAENKVAEDGIMLRDGEEELEGKEEDIWKDKTIGMQERLTAAKMRAAEQNKESLATVNEAVKAVGGNLYSLRIAMNLQKMYDRQTVKSVSDLARIMMQYGYMDDMRKGEVKRLLSAVKNATGKTDVAKEINTVMDIMTDNMLRRAETMLKALEKVKASKVDAKGVEVQGKLDVQGQQMLKAFKETRGYSEQELEEAMANAQEKMGSDNAAVAEEAANELAGLQVALDYVQNIHASRVEERELRKELAEAKGRELKEALEEAIRQNKIERVQAYAEIVEALSGKVGESVLKAKANKEAEIERVREIQHNANSDMEGRPSDEHYKPKFADKFVNNSFVQTLFAPLSTFEQMLRLFGNKSANGEGYLYNRFVRGWVDARQKELRGVRGKYETLDAKAREIFGKGVKNWGDVIRLSGKMAKMDVEFMDGGELKSHTLTQGNLMYIYMVNKMVDGRMKLRKMGVNDEAMRAIEERLDPRMKELADWLQGEFLVETRNEYNETHKRMFGASMAAIEDYFPLKILKNARVDKAEELDNPNQNEGISTSTGSIIKRRRNALALDLTGADALNVILDHVAQMEHWNAFAEYNRDLNTLRTYKHFRNQVKNMRTIYGSGEVLWKKFNDLCQMASGSYIPPRSKFDEAALNFAKGVTAAKVSFRVFTAMKQFLSFPAYFSEARPDLLAKNLATPWMAWKWGMENLPIFEERWKGKMAGDPRLLKSEMDWKMWRNNIVQLASKVGMSPNAFVDALTVSIGAHAVYETRKARYLKEGYNEEQAESRAIQDAEIAYNQTQQSSEGAFLSTMQVDRSWLSVMFTVFRNASMAYMRQLHDAVRNLKRSGLGLNKKYRAESIEFTTKQLIREGVEPEKARKAAETRFARQQGKDALRVGIFGYVLQWCWNMGPYLPYLLMGDDDDEKKKMWNDVWTHTAFGWLEGLTGGDVISSAGNMLLSGEGNPEYLSKDMPLESDIMNIMKKLGSNKKSEALTDVIDLVVQSGIGMNPQSITDGVLAIMDACGNDADLAREASICIMRILQFPQSQIDKIYFDEVGLSGSEVSEYTPAQLARRYAEYKVKRGHMLTPWKWNDAELIDKQEKNAQKKIKERVDKFGGEKVNEAYKAIEAELAPMAERVKAANKMVKEDHIESAKMWAEIHKSSGEEYKSYKDWKDMDKNLDELVKAYLQSETPEDAANYQKAIGDYKKAMVEVMEAEDDDAKREAKKEAREIRKAIRKKVKGKSEVEPEEE